MAVKGKSVALRPADCKQGGRDEPAGERCRLEVQKVEERGERAEGGRRLALGPAPTGGSAELFH